ncbi:MAG: FAD-linked oxidase C-terminal domain-containing protein [Acidimicrobiales bacterium]
MTGGDMVVDRGLVAARRWFRSRGRPGRPDPLDGCARDLVAALGSDAVRADAAARYLAARDASVFRGGAAGPVCFPSSTADVRAVVDIAAAHGRSVVPRGAGTGLTGATAPLGEPVVLALTRMNRVLSVDVDDRVAWVQPGVINLDLSRHLAPLGYHFAPDPSSQQVCTIGGNVANNSGGPHCLAYGVTSAHVVAIEVVLSSGDVVELGGLDAEPAGYDLRGAFVGSEGMFGVATSVAVRITPDPASVRTLLLSFADVTAAAATVGAIVAAGIVPAAMELLDQRCIVAVEDFVHAGYPREAAAALLAEVDGPAGGVEIDAGRIADIARREGATEVRVAADDEERALLWKGRKNAFGAIARIAPDYYLNDTVVPRSRLVDVLEKIYEIVDRHDVTVLNVFHAGDGNLHPILAFDSREPGMIERVHAAGREIVEASLAAGGVLSGEHGIGVEKRDFMSLQFSDDDLDHQNRLRRAFDPHCRMTPGKVLPAGHTGADIEALERAERGVWG